MRRLKDMELMAKNCGRRTTVVAEDMTQVNDDGTVARLGNWLAAPAGWRRGSGGGGGLAKVRGCGVGERDRGRWVVMAAMLLSFNCLSSSFSADNSLTVSRRCWAASVVSS